VLVTGRTVRDVVSAHDRKMVDDLLDESDLWVEKADKTVMVTEGDRAIATASLDANVIKMVAVRTDHRGEDLTALMIERLVSNLEQQGIFKHFLFTTPDQEDVFKALMYKKVSQTDDVILFENSVNPIGKRLDSLARTLPVKEGLRAAIVMNCNPVTNGHLHLIRTASKQNGDVIIFLVEEDASVFPFEVRRRLLEESVMDYGNVHVLPSTPYIISKATFPTYFLKETTKASRIHRKLDVKIFLDHFVPAFGLDLRYVGEEPLDPSTRLYNEALREVLKDRLVIVRRIGDDQGVISASRVRALMKAGHLEEVRAIVPPATYRFLESPEGNALFR
jgi:[citrate (pro-3S)-lyase] ligase